jgi:hypothetical protein
VLLTLPADAGKPMSAVLSANAEVKRHGFPAETRQISLRNTGPNTLWISLDRENWTDIASGTSWDDRARICELWYCTQTGTTGAALIALVLFDTGAA